MALSASLLSAALAADPTLILHNGKIVTVDKQFSIRQAMAIAENRILAVGQDREILPLAGPRTQVINLSGRMVIPGLIDSHLHPVGAAMTEFDHPIPQMDTIPDVLAYIRERARIVKDGDWIVLQQVFITRLREQRYPTRAELDAAAPRHPVVFRTGPDASVNTLALKLGGIDKNFTIPAGTPGRIEKDEQGEPTGILRTFVNYLKIPESERQPTQQEQLQRLSQLFQDYNSVGLTCICDRDAFPPNLDLYSALRERHQLSLRVCASYHIDTAGPIEDIVENIRKVARSPLVTEKSDWLRVIGIKTYLDGGMLTGSAYMLDPWGVSKMYGISDPYYHGVLFIPHDRLVPMVRAAVQSGLQFTAHSVGDGAVHALLNAYEQVNQEMPIQSTRPCVSHANFETAEDVARFAQLGVSPDIQPAWLYLDTRTLAKHFGYERLRWFQPLKSLFAAGVHAGGGSDHMQKIGSLRSNNPYDPFLGIQTAVTRKAKWYDGALHPEEALTREQALRFYTINNAWNLFLDDKLGSLEPGKLADFAVLDTDLLTCPAEKIVNTHVLKTYIDGKLVFNGK